MRRSSVENCIHRGGNDLKRMNVPFFTTVAAANAATEAIKELKTKDVSTPKSIQEFLNY